MVIEQYNSSKNLEKDVDTYKIYPRNFIYTFIRGKSLFATMYSRKLQQCLAEIFLFVAVCLSFGQSKYILLIFIYILNAKNLAPSTFLKD